MKKWITNYPEVFCSDEIVQSKFNELVDLFQSKGTPFKSFSQKVLFTIPKLI